MRILNHIKSLLILSLGNKIANDKYKYNFNDDERLFQNYMNYLNQIDQLKTILKQKLFLLLECPDLEPL